MRKRLGVKPCSLTWSWHSLPRPAHALKGRVPSSWLPSSCPGPASPHTTVGRPGAAPVTAGEIDRKEPPISTLAKRIKVFTFRSHSLCYLQEARYPDMFSDSQEGIQMKNFPRVPCNWKDSCDPTSVAENTCAHFPQARLEPEASLLQAGWDGKARGGGGAAGGGEGHPTCCCCPAVLAGRGSPPLCLHPHHCSHPLSPHCLSAAIFKTVTRLSDHILLPSSVG